MSTNSSFTMEHLLHALFDVAAVVGSLHSMLVARSHDLESHLGWTISTPTNTIKDLSVAKRNRMKTHFPISLSMTQV